MIRKTLILVLCLFVFQTVWGQQDIKSIIRELNNLTGGERISAENIQIKISRDSLDFQVKSIEILEFRERNHPLFADHFRYVVDNFQTSRYQKLPSESLDEHTYIRVRNGYIRELIVFSTGSRFGIVHARGKMKMSDFWNGIGERFNLGTTGDELQSEPQRPEGRQSQRQSRKSNSR